VNKAKYKCMCGHPEEVHNFDPYSAFFGCCHSLLIAKTNHDGSPAEPEEETCKCDEFRPDTLRYVEDVYVECTDEQPK
jgi:hypothetical protein